MFGLARVTPNPYRPATAGATAIAIVGPSYATMKAATAMYGVISLTRCSSRRRASPLTACARRRMSWSSRFGKSEGYGFSNDAKGVMGAPSFSAASFPYNGQNLELTMSLHDRA